MSEVKSVPLKELFEDAKKKYPQNHKPIKVEESGDHVCITCGEPIKGKDYRKKYCSTCKPKHSITFKLNDEEYELFLEYYNIFGCDSVSQCVKDLVLEGVKQ